MTRIIGISGSTRKGSFNAALLRAAVAAAPAGTEIEIASIAEIPLYNGDLEAEHGIPAPVAALKDKIAAADGLLLVTPEYNNSIPGVFKNAIDWCSRPGKDIARVFGGRAVGIMGATPGPGGTRLAQVAWLPTLRTLGTRLFSTKFVYVSGAATAFDAEGNLVDEKLRKVVSEFMAGFAAFAAFAAAK